MVKNGVQRRLATIIAADVAGYSRLMGVDEESTFRTLQSYREIIDRLIVQHEGRIFTTGGDSVLAEFASPVEAVRCAVTIQKELRTRNAELTSERQMKFRIGINVGDVMTKDNNLYGDAVNVAARLESIAEEGGICISGSTFDHVNNKLSFGFEDIGPQMVKNIIQPVPAFRVVSGPSSMPSTTSAPAIVRRWRMLATVTAAVLVITIIGVAWWQPWTSDVEAASVERMVFPLPDRPSIAVLPFTNMSDDKDQDYFADGIADDIITDISKVSGIFVVARNSTFTYKGKPVKVGQIAEDLGVRYVLEGSVRRDENKLRINAQLTDAIKGVHLWADRYDRELNDVFAVQSEITERVVKALAVTLKANEHDRLFQKYVTNIDAYDMFLRARETVDAPTRSNIEKGEKLFKKVIDLDSDFAGGYAGLSFNYSVKARFRFGPSPQDDAQRALEFAKKAIQADKNLAWSHIALAGAHLANSNHDAALDAVRQAIVIQPSGYESNLFMGFYLNFAGQSSEAVKYLEIANTLSRIDTIRGLDFLGMAYFTDGKYIECEAAWTRRFQKFGIPNYPIGHVFLAAAQALSDRMDKAAATVERFRRISPDFRMSQWLWINNYKLSENRVRLFNAAVSAGIPE